MDDDEIGAAEAAQILGLSKCRVIQLKNELNGCIKIGRLIFSRQTVTAFGKRPRPPGWKLGRKRKPKSS
jgi:hypothetical protein